MMAITGLPAILLQVRTLTTAEIEDTVLAPYRSVSHEEEASTPWNLHMTRKLKQ